MYSSRYFSKITIKLDRRFYCLTELILRLYFLIVQVSFWLIYLFRNNENNEPKSRRKMKAIRFALERADSTLSRMIEFIFAPHCAVDGWRCYIRGKTWDKQKYQASRLRAAKDKRAAAITINQSLLELSNTPFAMGSAKNILVYRTF